MPLVCLFVLKVQPTHNRIVAINFISEDIGRLNLTAHAFFFSINQKRRGRREVGRKKLQAQGNVNNLQNTLGLRKSISRVFFWLDLGLFLLQTRLWMVFGECLLSGGPIRLFPMN